MKKIQLLTGALLVASSVFAQKAEPTKIDHVQHSKKTVQTIQSAKSVAIWSNDFSDASTWNLTNTGGEDINWSIETDVNAMPDAAAGAIFPFAATTVANGYALINSDGAPGNMDGNGAIIAQLTTVNPIDLSANSSVLLKFSHNYRWYRDTRGVRVSGDNGSTWTEYELTNLDGYPNDQNSENPTVEAINISAVAGGQSQVLIQFYYNDNDIWAWYWAVDDVEILDLPANDIILSSAWVSSTSGVEYGRTPLAHVSDTLIVGGQVYNFGSDTQSDIEITLDVNDASGSSVISEYSTIASLENDSTDFGQVVVTEFNLAKGVYEFTSVASSTGDNANGSSFGDNTYVRNFEVTDNLYSVDGIDVYDSSISSVDGIGTNYGNGTIVMVRYELLVATDVVGLELGIHSASAVDGQVFPFLVTEEVMASEDVDLSSSNRIAENEEGVMLSQADIDNGVMFVELTPTTLSAGVYYACIELYAGPVEGDALYILDDETVAQPNSASMIYTADDGSAWTNGTAAAVRLAINDYAVGIDEAKTALFSVSPNPSNGVFTVTANNADNYTLEVINVLGEVVSAKSIEGSMNETVNVSELNAGIYFVKVSTATSQNVQRVVIK